MKHKKIYDNVLIRHKTNPILTAEDFPYKMRAVYNSAAIKLFDGNYTMLCRVNQLNHKTLLWGADSIDGIHFTLRDEPFSMPEDKEWENATRSAYYDPRITYIDERYIVLLATEGDQGCRVAMFDSRDLKSLNFMCYINVPDNRNMVLFPEKTVDGRYMRLERPSTMRAGGKGNIWISYSPDLVHWGDSKEVLKSSSLWNYCYSGLGASTVPHKTSDGWLVIFHGIMNNCTTREYSAGAMLLDLEDPSKVLHVTEHPILYPQADYEMIGLVEHVVFPCSMIVEEDETIKVYYGGADTVQCVATGTLKDLINACKNH